jgi:dTMP kinase
MPGRLIAVCGIDGSGKTTQIERLRHHLDSRGVPLLTTRQPTDRYRRDVVVRSALDLDVSFEEVGEELALLSAFDRARHLREEVLPELARGTCVITDRYVYSTYAYFVARGVRDLTWLMSINRAVPEPDVTLYLDVPPDVAVTRILARDGASQKREELDTSRMARVREIFLSQPWGRSERFRVVDATLGPDEVWQQIWSTIEALELV